MNSPPPLAPRANRRLPSLVDLADVVESQYVLRCDLNWRDLFQYTTQHWEVLPILFEAPEKIREFFGDVRPILDLVTDLEEGWERLFLVIPTRGSVLQALERLKQLDAVWFVEAARRARFAVNVTIEQYV